jgi:S-adenosylmethionine:diacylglycerol 3-amino-3-carboxypropyl transferase
MYEDPEIELTAFQAKSRVFCIASAGTVAFRLANQHEVIACDINPAQLAYAERRAGGYRTEEGDAERIMNFMRVFMPLVGWRERVVHAFLALSDTRQQIAFWRTHLNTCRFRAGFDLAMSPIIMRTVYAKRFLSCLPSRFGAVLRKRLERGFSRHPNTLNPFARALLLGERCEEFRPTAANIHFVLSDAASWLQSCEAGSFDAFALSNILDGAAPAYRSRLSQAVRRAASRDAVVVVRSMAEPAVRLDTNHAERDRSMLWGIVDVRSAYDF